MARPLIVALAVAVSLSGAWADRYSDCDQDADLDRQMRGCTEIVERDNQESVSNRAGPSSRADR